MNRYDTLHKISDCGNELDDLERFMLFKLELDKLQPLTTQDLFYIIDKFVGASFVEGLWSYLEK